MAVTIKQNSVYYKNSDGEYVGVDVYSESPSIDELKSALTALREHLVGVKNALNGNDSASAIAILDQCVLDLDVLG